MAKRFNAGDFESPIPRFESWWGFHIIKEDSHMKVAIIFWMVLVMGIVASTQSSCCSGKTTENSNEVVEEETGEIRVR